MFSGDTERGTKTVFGAKFKHAEVVGVFPTFCVKLCDHIDLDLPCMALVFAHPSLIWEFRAIRVRIHAMRVTLHPRWCHSNTRGESPRPGAPSSASAEASREDG